MSENKAIAKIPVEVDPKTGRLAYNDMDGLQRVAKWYSETSMVPESFRGKLGECMAVVQLARQLGSDPFMLFQCVYFVHGRPGIETKFAIAQLNVSGRIKGVIRYRCEGKGKSMSCAAVVTDAATGEEIVGPEIDWEMVKAEKWDAKPGSKWQTMPSIMFRYRAAIFLIRTTYPDVLMGMLSTEELQDIPPTVVKHEVGGLKELTESLKAEAEADEDADFEPPKKPEVEVEDDAESHLLSFMDDMAEADSLTRLKELTAQARELDLTDEQDFRFSVARSEADERLRNSRGQRAAT